MPLLIISFTILFWVFIVFLIKKYNLEKEGLLFLISSTLSIYIILIFQDIVDLIKKKKQIYDFYKKNPQPYYINYFREELYFLNNSIINKIKKHLKLKKIIDINSNFLNKFFFSLELSIQKEEYFYNLTPLQSSSNDYKLFNLNLTMNDICILVRNTLTENEQSIIRADKILTYRKPGDEFLDVGETTTILYRICQLSSNFTKILKTHYENYFSDNDIKTKLILSTSDKFKLDNIFNLIFLLDDKHFDEKEINELTKESQLLNISDQKLCFLSSYSSYSKEFQYKYIPLNFLDLITEKFKNNLFIERLSLLIENNKNLYVQPTFNLELQKFLDFINSLRLVNELNDRLPQNQSKSKIIKI